MEASLARTVLTTAPMGVLAIDSVGRVRLANPTAEAMWGCPIAANNGLLSDVLPGFDLNLHFAEARETGTQHLQAIVGGVPRELEISAVPFDAPEERMVALFIRDDTDRVRAEGALQKLRTEIILTWRLNSLGELASLVGHEINQPLAAMTTLVHIAREDLKQKGLDPDIIEALDQAAEQARRAAEIIRRFRALLSRRTAFHSDVSPQQLASELEPLLRLQARDAGVSVHLDVDDAALRCDPIQIQQVLTNLFRNACMHGRASQHPMVVISGHLEGDAYVFAVADNGPGFTETESCFEPQTGNPEGGGMGLGLSISKRIIEAHDGVITAANRREGGALVRFTLPLGESA